MDRLLSPQVCRCARVWSVVPKARVVRLVEMAHPAQDLVRALRSLVEQVIVILALVIARHGLRIGALRGGHTSELLHRLPVLVEVLDSADEAVPPRVLFGSEEVRLRARVPGLPLRRNPVVGQVVEVREKPG